MTVSSDDCHRSWRQCWQQVRSRTWCCLGGSAATVRSSDPSVTVVCCCFMCSASCVRLSTIRPFPTQMLFWTSYRWGNWIGMRFLSFFPDFRYFASRTEIRRNPDCCWWFYCYCIFMHLSNFLNANLEHSVCFDILFLFCFGTGGFYPMVWLPQCQWSNPEEYG